jgi:Major Facilitator Superfamily
MWSEGTRERWCLSACSARQMAEDVAVSVSWMRWVVLAVFSATSMIQSCVWLTFGAVAPQATAFYAITNGTIFLFEAYGPIFYMVTAVPAMQMARTWGLRLQVVVGGLAIFVAGVLRWFATGPSTVWLLHVAQALDCLAGPVVLGSTTNLSRDWFAPHERGLATSIALTFNSVGTLIGYIWTAYAVEELGMVAMLRWTSVSIFVIFFFIIVAFPRAPPQPPSKTAAIHRAMHPIPATGSPFLDFFVHGWGSRADDVKDPSDASDALLLSLADEGGEEGGQGSSPHSPHSPHSPQSQQTTWEALWVCFSTPDFVLLTVTFAITMGAWVGWTSVLSIVLSGGRWHMSDSMNPKHMLESSAWDGTWITAAGVVGGIAGGAWIDVWPRHRIAILIMSFISAIFYALWAAIFFNYIHSSAAMLFTIGLLGSATLNAAGPIFMELGAEVTYPVDEVVSGGIIQIAMNLGSLAFQLAGLAPAFTKDPTPLNWALPACTVAACLILLFVRGQTRRLAIDDDRAPDAPHAHDTHKHDALAPSVQ